MTAATLYRAKHGKGLAHRRCAARTQPKATGGTPLYAELARPLTLGEQTTEVLKHQSPSLAAGRAQEAQSVGMAAVDPRKPTTAALTLLIYRTIHREM